MAEIEIDVLEMLCRVEYDPVTKHTKITHFLGQRVTVPDVSDKVGHIVALETDDGSIGVLYDGPGHAVYYDADMVKPVE